MATRKKINGRNRARGKAHEKKIAELLGGQRLGLMGGQDVEAGAFSVECKSLSNMPGYLRNFYAQAERHAHGRIPIVAIHEKNHAYEKDFVLIRLDVWMARILPLLEGGREVGVTADLQEVYERLGEILAAAD
jgi:hypothetical protein